MKRRAGDRGRVLPMALARRRAALSVQTSHPSIE